MRWVYYIALLRTYSFCVCAQCVRVKPNKRMSNWTNLKLFLDTVRIYCVSYCYIVAHSKLFILFLVDFMKNDYRKKPDYTSQPSIGSINWGRSVTPALKGSSLVPVKAIYSVVKTSCNTHVYQDRHLVRQNACVWNKYYYHNVGNLYKDLKNLSAGGGCGGGGWMEKNNCIKLL